MNRGLDVVVFEIAGSAEERRRATHDQLREQLAERLDVEPAQLRFNRDGQGRPYLPDGGAEFSIARSGNVAALALAPAGYRVGVDIEVRRRIPAAAAVSREFLPPCLAALAHAPEPDAFLAAWTVLEASLKAEGKRLDGRTREHEPWPHCTVRLPDGVFTVALARLGQRASDLLRALGVRRLRTRELPMGPEAL